MANGSPALTDDERQRQLAALAASGKFPGAQSAVQGLGGTGGPPVAPQPPAPQQAGPPGAPPPQAAPAPQPPAPGPQGGAPPPMQLPGQSGITGFLGNPMVMGLLSGYLNAIRTPRYMGRGALMANAGLGFLSGMSGAEQAITQQEKDKLEMEKQRLSISKDQKVAEAWDRINSGKGTDADYLIVGQAQYLETKQHREDIISVNKQNGLLFAQDHPGPLGARIGGAMMKNTEAVVSQSEAESAYQAAVKDPSLAEEVAIGLQQKKADLAQTLASTAGTKATTASTLARLPGEKAESEEKVTEAQIFTRGTPDMTPEQLHEAQREKVFGRAKAVTWVDRDPKSGEIYGYVPGTADAPPNYAAKGQWVESGAMGQIGREKRAEEKEHLQWMQSKSNPADIYSIDLNKGEKPRQEGDLPWKPGTIGKPSYKTYVDENGQTQTIDVNKEAPHRDWKPYSTGAVGAPLAEQKAEADLTKKILAEYSGRVARPFGANFANWPVVGAVVSPDVQQWYEDARQYGISKYGGFDIKTGEYPGKRKPGAPAATPSAAPTPDAATAARLELENNWARYKFAHSDAQKITRTDADGTIHHGGRAAGVPDEWFD